MKIKLTTDLPIDKKHGASKGVVFNVIEVDYARGPKYWFYGITGEKCAAFKHEVEVIDD